MSLFRKKRRVEIAGKQDDRSWERRPDWLVDGLAVELFEGSQILEVVGESNYQDGLDQVVRSLAKKEHYGHRGDSNSVRVPVHGVLVAETNNPYDANAISVWVSGLKAGYLSRDTAASIRPGLLRLQEEVGKAMALEGVIVGRPGIYGVFLNHDPEDFGLSGGAHGSVPPPPGAKLRTGMSEAMESDQDDDSYDLSWQESLSSDKVKRIPQLRKLLEAELDPLDRHYMLTFLEADLYSCRDLWASALDEYDAVAELHHHELERGMRAALLEKFGKIPLIETYRQSAIRAQKAKVWSGVELWARRGIGIYGDNAARSGDVADLQKRLEKAVSHLSPN